METMQAGLGRERSEQRRAGILRLLPRERKERPTCFQGRSVAGVHGRRASHHRRPSCQGGLSPDTTARFVGLQQSVCNRHPIHVPDLTAGTSLATHAIPRSLHHAVNAASNGANSVEPLDARVKGQLEVAMPVGTSKVRIQGSLVDSIVCDVRASWFAPSLDREGWRNQCILRSVPFKVF
mmetsp:Transcript_238/g.1921  ORF Transcript_238/g.1921 Transcript_238/m.1921 type:complete len:180 (-) Transcript_238:326-865(-)